MKSTVALVGRPNVGKSTLFNRLTRSKDALVADQPGLTRDRIYGTARYAGSEFIVIDTAGIAAQDDEIASLTEQQARRAIGEADVVLFLVDARTGLTAADEVIAAELRRGARQTVLLVNKAEGLPADVAMADFYGLGFRDHYCISAAHGDGVTQFLDALTNIIDVDASAAESGGEKGGIKVAFVGRPNVGKSTLTNRILGEERVVVCDQPGTTRDSVFIPFSRDGSDFVLIDTAGLRRRSRVEDRIEKFSVVKTLQAVEASHVVVLVVDARAGIAEQDAHIAGFVVESGRAVVMAINKWDGIDADRKQALKRELDLKLGFLDFAQRFYISALHGSGVGDLFPAVITAFHNASRTISTARLNDALQEAVRRHQPPLVKGRRIKLRYIHQGGRNPPVFVIHGNQTGLLPDSYRRYLVNFIRQRFDLQGTPVRVELRTGVNPFGGRRNRLTKRQVAKRKRLMRYVKKNR